ncbi:hypothetical protein BOTBODRAFT_601057 [Botryobasidium botryosum FD-172 SS1]|uniref:Uncharacterized protein n=1 Tax=Botryobasidium botryosum (strain FD-172 SS1) TaxID=930990 RepID=A0A067MN92_BOTB1|nr:hypothetical protein BOTBODRAFT_601057 [Botryobasidium botryosum FD-172 SS1]
MGFGYYQAVLVGVWLETLIYALYIPLFVTFLWIVLRRKPAPASGAKWTLLAPVILLFVLATMHVGVGLRRIIRHESLKTPDSMAWQEAWTYWEYAVSEAIYVAISFIGNSIVIYRCYLVCVRWNWVIMWTPPLFLAGSTGLFIYAIYENYHSHTEYGGWAAFLGWIFSYTVIFTCTLFMLYRIWRLNRSMRLGRSTRVQILSRLGGLDAGTEVGVGSGSRGVLRALAVIVESAAIYAVSATLFFGFYIAGLDAETVIYLANAQIITIASTLILVRAALGLTPMSGWVGTSDWADSQGEALVTRGE